jgi:flagellar hook-associated protein 2
MLNAIANSLGSGSGIDVASLVTDLAAASRGPKVQRFDALARTNQSKISAVAQARSDLDSFVTSLGDLVAGGTLRSQPTVSDATAITATAVGGVRLGNLSSEIEITQLARSQSIYSAFLPAATDPVGQGGMTLTVGSNAYPIAINAGNDSLTGLAAAINASGSGVSASVSSDANGARIVLKGETGATKAFTLSADAGADPALNRFSYSNSGSGMILGQSALDSRFKLDGVDFTRTSNSFSDVISGVNITLKMAVPGAPIAISAQRPTDTIRQTVTDFVSVFNTLKRDLGAAKQVTGSDQSVRALDAQLASLVRKAIISDPRISSLADIGIATNRNGTLNLDAAKLNSVLQANPDAVEAIFNPLRDDTHTAATDPGIAVSLAAIRDAATSQNGLLDSLRSRLEKEASAITSNREKMETRETSYRQRLEQKFGNMDARITALRATQSYLEQQIKLWSNPQQ